MREHEKDADWWFTELEWEISTMVLARVYRAGATNKLPSRSWGGRERC